MSNPPSLKTSLTAASKRACGEDDTSGTTTAPVVIVGGGLVGLTLALALKQHVGPGALSALHQKHSCCKIEVYEQAPEYLEGIGAGMGLYPNGLRVLQDIDEQLLWDIQAAGYPYLTRRWERHDGTTVVEADDTKLGQQPQPHQQLQQEREDDEANRPSPLVLTEDSLKHNNQVLDKDEKAVLHEPLQPLGIRRWKLQHLLWQAVRSDPDIVVHFNKKLERVFNVASGNHTSPQTQLIFEDGHRVVAHLILAADGAKSRMRTLWMMQQQQSRAQSPSWAKPSISQLKYTGTTCWYGVATLPRAERGICFPTSPTNQNYQKKQAGRRRIVHHARGRRATSETLLREEEEDQSQSSSTVSTSTTGTTEPSSSSHNNNEEEKEESPTQLHACFFPTGPHEQCFQFHMPTPLEHKDNNWSPYINLLDDVTNTGSCGSSDCTTNENEGGKQEGEEEAIVDKGAPKSGTSGGWTALIKGIEQQECLELAHRLEAEGWNYEKYIAPLHHVEQAIKVPFAMLDPPLPKFHFRFNAPSSVNSSSNGLTNHHSSDAPTPLQTLSSNDTTRVVLVGDAAHPPVPYLGQGLQQGLEDAGTLALLLKQALCMDGVGGGGGASSSKSPPSSQSPLQKRLDTALELYSQLRVPRTNQILHQYSRQMGHWQQSRSFCAVQAQGREELLKRQVFFHETHSALLPGTTYDYQKTVEEAIAQQDWPLPALREDDDDEEESEPASTTSVDVEGESGRRCTLFQSS